MIIEFIPSYYIERQLAINDFSKKIKSIIRQDNPRTFNHEQVVVILLELAKNTFDHSNGIGIVEINISYEFKSILLKYKDTGKQFDYEKFSELGISEKIGNNINYGIGLTLVKQGAIGAGFNLSVERLEEYTQFEFSRLIK